tara:strand:+ start:3154 stop:3441 length:288 start_codon:yes stop_codon:yes gene_type:complete
MTTSVEKLMQVLSDRLECHIKECNTRELDVDDRLDKLIQAQELNATNIAKLTEATNGVVEAWTVANGLSKFLKWLSSFAIIGGIAAWLNGFIKLT